MAKLAVNVDHVATLREVRKVGYPDPVAAAIVAEQAGADSIVAHIRLDRRHIRKRDLRILKEVVTTRLILEMAATPEMLDIALEIRPDRVTLVPETVEEMTTEGGLDVAKEHTLISETALVLKKSGIETCLFVDPDVKQIEMVGKTGIDMIEIHTGAYCDLEKRNKSHPEYARLVNAVLTASGLNLKVTAGHGINYNSINDFRGLPQIREYSIGHGIISRSVFTGLPQAVREMKHLIEVL
jgi:pyridoxine 5-phosphate synthase